MKKLANMQGQTSNVSRDGNSKNQTETPETPTTVKYQTSLTGSEGDLTQLREESLSLRMYQWKPLRLESKGKSLINRKQISKKCGTVRKVVTYV